MFEFLTWCAENWIVGLLLFLCLFMVIASLSNGISLIVKAVVRRLKDRDKYRITQLKATNSKPLCDLTNSETKLINSKKEYTKQRHLYIKEMPGTSD